MAARGAPRGVALRASPSGAPRMAMLNRAEIPAYLGSCKLFPCEEVIATPAPVPVASEAGQRGSESTAGGSA